MMRVLAALASAVVLGALLGAADLAFATRTCSGLGCIVTVMGLDVFASTLVLAPLFIVLTSFARTPAIARLLESLRRPGPRRAGAIAACFVLGVLTIVTWSGALALVHHALHAYRDPGVIVVFAASEVIGACLAAAVFLIIALPAAQRWGARSHRLIAVTGRWHSALLAYVAAVTVLAGGLWAMGRALEPADPRPAYEVLVGVAGAVALAALRPARWLGRLACYALAASTVVLSIVALLALEMPETRVAVSGSGPLARTLLGVAYALEDGDGDGVPGGLGGADCNDHDPAISPLATEIPGNGIDENCTGADAQPGAEPAIGAAGAPQLDVVLVTIDTLRADHVGAYGYARSTTPSFDALARTSTLFERAIAPATVTNQSLPAILFGRHPSTLPFVRDRALTSAHGVPNIASVLAGIGYRTTAVMAIPNVLADSWTAGFDSVIVVGKDVHRDNAPQVTAAALAALDGALTRPRFTWIHYADPHYPYDVPPGAARFGDRDLDRYDSEIAAVDAELGRLLANIDRTHTIIIVTADHGEGFGDHGYSFHGQSLLQDQIDVPLLVFVPGAAAHTIHAPVSLVSVAATLVELVGATRPATFASSLTPAIRRGTEPTAPVLAELFRARTGVSRNSVALVTTAGKLIWDIDDNAYEWYDGRDRNDAKSLPAPPDAIVALRRALDELLTRLPESASLASIPRNR